MFLFELINLGEGFKKYFEVVPALTDELRDHVFRIRHAVYCAELQYEPVRADQRERDDYDAHALHCLVRSVHTGEYVGCTRLVLARPGDPLYPLPVEKTCAGTIDRSIVDPQKLPRHAIAEISRLAVIARYRSRRDEDKSPAPLNDESFGTADRPRFPYLTVGLYLATIELARQHNIATIIVLTEPRLAHHFRKLGVDIRQIGGPVEHRGTRVPSIMTVASIISGLNFLVRPLYKVVAEEVVAGMRAQGRLPAAERSGGDALAVDYFSTGIAFSGGAGQELVKIKAMHALARELLCRVGSHKRVRRRRRGMHQIDQLELSKTVLEIRAAAESLLASTQDRALGVRRILALLGYLAEHLEMIGGESHGRPEWHPPEAREWIPSMSVTER